jgi:hypothetical protein
VRDLVDRLKKSMLFPPSPILPEKANNLNPFFQEIIERKKQECFGDNKGIKKKGTGRKSA